RGAAGTAPVDPAPRHDGPAAGARRDIGQLDAAIVTLQSPELASNSVQPWTARLRYAYADALLAAGREDEAREWFAKAVESDKDGSTDASDRLAELDGVEFVDALVEDEDEVAPEAEAEAEDEAEDESETATDAEADTDPDTEVESEVDDEDDIVEAERTKPVVEADDDDEAPRG
ncbi:tetratricopeptide repeat protein, partial [Streptomyces sp. NPDC057927]